MQRLIQKSVMYAKLGIYVYDAGICYISNVAKCIDMIAF
jgi:hypothetical protein